MSVPHTTMEKEEITGKEEIPEQGGLAEKEGISESRIHDVRREPPSLYEDDDEEDFKFTIGKAVACFVGLPSCKLSGWLADYPFLLQSFIVGNFAVVLILILGSSIVATINKDVCTFQKEIHSHVFTLDLRSQHQLHIGHQCSGGLFGCACSLRWTTQ
jgi:hypothetical protein